MGLQSDGQLLSHGQSIHVTALLESQALILRGAVKQSMPITEISDPRAVHDQLLFEYSGKPYAIALPDGQAEKWVKKLTSAPRTLAQKLGLGENSKALVWGDIDDPALVAALRDATAQSAEEAVQSICLVREPDQLSEALSQIMRSLPYAPIWIVFPKGFGSALPESAVRNHLRSLGFVDTKVSAVSPSLTAMRFNHGKTAPKT